MLKTYLNKGIIEAGVDEAGRGCLAGPVVAAAVILPAGYKNEVLNDSKLLTPEIRNELRTEIERTALAYAVASVDNNEIDIVNILNATYRAMHKALEQLKTLPAFILVDGDRFQPFRNLPHRCIIKGDGTFMSIAAASVLAKTYRDEMMVGLNDYYPVYNWKQNKGYATLEHRKAIMRHGITEYHRKSFKLYEDLELF